MDSRERDFQTRFWAVVNSEAELAPRPGASLNTYGHLMPSAFQGAGEKLDALLTQARAPANRCNPRHNWPGRTDLPPEHVCICGCVSAEFRSRLSLELVPGRIGNHCGLQRSSLRRDLHASRQLHHQVPKFQGIAGASDWMVVNTSHPDNCSIALNSRVAKFKVAKGGKHETPQSSRELMRRYDLSRPRGKKPVRATVRLVGWLHKQQASFRRGVDQFEEPE